MAKTLFRVECVCHHFSACTDSHYEAQCMKRLHEQWNADVKRGQEPAHRVKITAQFDYVRSENPVLLDAISTLPVEA